MMYSIDFWIDKRAEITPNRIALKSQQTSMTYFELQQSMNKLAYYLQEKYSIEKGARVAILSSNRIEYLIAYFALAKLGSIVVPLNIRLTANELAFQLNDSGSKLLIYEKEFQSIKDEIFSLTEIESAFDIDCWHEEESNIVQYVSPSIEKDGDDRFIICYTSGTTGRPKGAVLTHANMYWNAINNIVAIDINSYDRIIVLLPLFHIGGIGLFAFPGFLAGATVLVQGKFNPDLAIEMIENEKVTIVMGVPAIHDAIRKSPLFENSRFESVRWFYNGGATCPKDVYEAYLDRGLPFGGGFGMTEASPTIFMTSKEDFARKPDSIGKPVMFCECKLVGENGEPVKQGEVGELYIKGPNVMKEYWQLKEATESTFHNGWLKTGDLMRQDEEGFYYVAGRKKDMIISGGENIYPLEVEQVISEFPEVDEVAVVGTVDAKWGEVPIAFIKFHDNQTLSKEQLIERCQKRLGKYKIPKHFYQVDELPRNATGKIMKTALKQEIYEEQELI